jgi:ectoine hydroxylase-related dioxygenase (phytanoyl-CoA dioxygenase family)
MDAIDVEKLKSSFNNDGYVVIKNVFSPEEMPPLLDAIKSADRYENTSNPGLTRGTMEFRSNTFYKNEFIQSFISQQKIIDLLKPIVGEDIWARWDQAVGKGPSSPFFPWHQDNGYNKLPIEHYQFWIAVTKSTSENGTILISPGSHKNRMMPHNSDGQFEHYDGDITNATMIEADPGDVLIFSSFTLHATLENTTENDTRWAYVIEYMSLDDFDPTVNAPYFVVARDGKSSPEFVTNHPASTLSDNFHKSLYAIKHYTQHKAHRLSILFTDLLGDLPFLG